jgi:TRAP-type uncharacterized transport system fused permease subunit
MFCFSSAFMRYLKTNSRLYESTILIVAGALFLLPWLWSNLVAFAPLALVVALQVIRTKGVVEKAVPAA